MNANEREYGKEGSRRSRPISVHWRLFAVSLLPAALFAFLALATMRAFLALFAPEPYEPPVEAFTAYDRSDMLAAVSPTNVRQRLDEVAALGDRFVGQPGFYAAEAMIRDAYREAGLEVLIQEFLHGHHLVPVEMAERRRQPVRLVGFPEDGPLFRLGKNAVAEQ